MGKINSKAKGNRGENLCKAFLKSWSKLSFERVPQSGGLGWHNREQVSGDLICTEKGYDFKYSIEVKLREEINFAHLILDVDSEILGFWKQAIYDAGRAGKKPIVFFRVNNQRPSGSFYFMIQKALVPMKYRKSLKPYIIYNNDILISTSDRLKKINFETFNNF